MFSFAVKVRGGCVTFLYRTSAKRQLDRARHIPAGGNLGNPAVMRAVLSSPCRPGGCRPMLIASSARSHYAEFIPEVINCDKLRLSSRPVYLFSHGTNIRRNSLSFCNHGTYVRLPPRRVSLRRVGDSHRTWLIDPTVAAPCTEGCVTHDSCLATGSRDNPQYAEQRRQKLCKRKQLAIGNFNGILHVFVVT